MKSMAWAGVGASLAALGNGCGLCTFFGVPAMGYVPGTRSMLSVGAISCQKIAL
jgi:hypothetical protein